MAWYHGTYSCGHDGEVDIIGPTKDRQRKADWRFSGLCPECYQKKKQEELEAENRKAEEQSSEMELPLLAGTEKQVAWANTIRISIVNKIEENLGKLDEISSGRKLFVYNDIREKVYTSKEELSAALGYVLHTYTDARFWIDNRNNEKISFAFLKAYRENMDIPKAVREEMECQESSTTVVPESGASESGIVKIQFEAGYLSAEYVKNAIFMEIVKGLGYRWDGASWKKEISEYTGTMEDRAAELGNSLLSRGFAVQFPNVEAKNLSITGSFARENDRWVKYQTKTDQLAIVWKKRSDTLYDAAKKLPGARWKDGSMRVGIEFYREVEDFAETLGFSISNMAQEKIDEYKKKEAAFEAVAVKSAKAEDIDDSERIRKSLEASGTIIEDLMD